MSQKKTFDWLRYDFIMSLERSKGKFPDRNLRGILHEITIFRSVLNFYHISINTCAMIGQLSGPYLTVRLAKFKTLFKLKSSSSI